MALRPKLNRIWASTNSNLRRDPGDAKYIQGWVSEIPTYQVLNFLQNKIDSTFLAIAERGIAEWGGDISYVKGALVWDESDGSIYVASVANPDKTKSPKSNPASWAKSSIQITRAQYDSLNNSIDTHIANKSNPHGVTAGMIGAYTKVEIDSIVTQYRSLVAAHAADKNNPHGTKAVDIGAVPVDGGEYTGIIVVPEIHFNNQGSLMAVDGGKLLTISHGTGRIKLSSNGDVFVGAVLSPVVTEKTFPLLRLNNQPSFVSPSPTFHWDLINNVNLRIGFGHIEADTVTSNPWDFDAETMMLIPKKSIYLKTPNVIYSGSITYAADVKIVAAGNAESAYIFSFGNSGINVTLKRPANNLDVVQVIAEMGATGGTTAWQGIYRNIPWSQGITKRIVVCCDKVGVSLFIDGILIEKKLFTSSAIVADKDLYLAPRIGPSGNEAKVAISNFRTWNVLLTNRQASAL